MKPAPFLHTCAVLAALCLAAPPAARAAEPADALNVYLCSNHMGSIEPCGCYPGQLGGLERLTGCLRARIPAGPPAVFVHAGPTVQANDRQAELKFNLAMRALARAGCRVYGLGASDLLLGRSFLAEAEKAAGLPFVASNLVDGAGRARLKTHALVTVGGRKLCVMSFIDPHLADYARPFAADSRLLPPRDLLAELAEGPAGEADLCIVFFHGSYDEAGALQRLAAKQLERTLAVVLMASHLAPGATRKRRSATIVAPGVYGQNVLRLKAAWSAQEKLFELLETAVIKLDKGTPSDELVRTWHGEYRATMAREDLVGNTPRIPAPFGETYVGGKTCIACHEPQQKIWARRPHAQAWKTLKDAGATMDPECVRCHVVGFPEKSGFLSEKKTPGLVDVGCEVCHGPLKKHARQTDLPETLKSRNRCQMCHTPEHSPGFDRAEYLEKIRHWDLKKPVKAPTAEPAATPEPTKEEPR
jgi:hypothetical protein